MPWFMPAIAYKLKLQKEIKLSESNKEMNLVFFIIVELFYIFTCRLHNN